MKSIRKTEPGPSEPHWTEPVMRQLENGLVDASEQPSSRPAKTRFALSIEVAAGSEDFQQMVE